MNWYVTAVLIFGGALISYYLANILDRLDSILEILRNGNGPPPRP